MSVCLGEGVMYHWPCSINSNLRPVEIGRHFPFTQVQALMFASAQYCAVMFVLPAWPPCLSFLPGHLFFPQFFLDIAAKEMALKQHSHGNWPLSFQIAIQVTLQWNDSPERRMRSPLHFNLVLTGLEALVLCL